MSGSFGNFLFLRGPGEENYTRFQVQKFAPGAAPRAATSSSTGPVDRIDGPDSPLTDDDSHLAGIIPTDPSQPIRRN
ncbi:hypothetical protein NL676_034441 [Syzygium grande]|nr:hypothetical protein NL676_034441 [Syzygium grande]